MSTCSLDESCARPETLGGGCYKHKFEGGVRVTGMALFKHDRDLGVTQMEKDREQQDMARKDGLALARKPGMRGPTHKKTADGWQKVIG